jgi:hypothetical protein
MSDPAWACAECGRLFSRLDVAWGWAALPHCGDCWEAVVGKTRWEPPMAMVCAEEIARARQKAEER